MDIGLPRLIGGWIPGEGELAAKVVLTSQEMLAWFAQYFNQGSEKEASFRDVRNLLQDAEHSDTLHVGVGDISAGGGVYVLQDPDRTLIEAAATPMEQGKQALEHLLTKKRHC